MSDNVHELHPRAAEAEKPEAQAPEIPLHSTHRTSVELVIAVERIRSHADRLLNLLRETTLNTEGNTHLLEGVFFAWSAASDANQELIAIKLECRGQA